LNRHGDLKGALKSVVKDRCESGGGDYYGS
jgi:hypothetical protein